MPTTITVEVPDFTGEDLEGAIVQQIANQMLSWTSYGPDGESGQVNTKLYNDLRRFIEDEIKQQAKEAVPTIVADMLEKGIQRYGSYGSPMGDPVPLREAIGDEIAKQIGEDVRRYGSSNSSSPLQKIIAEQVQKAFRGELMETIQNAKTTALKAVSDEAQNAIAQALERALPAAR